MSASGRTHFRIWAPESKSVHAVIEGVEGKLLPEPKDYELFPEGDGFFSNIIPVSSGALYRFRLDESESLLPDLASRFQPEGPFGPSEIIDPSGYKWKDGGWKGLKIKGQVIYEMHVGTFTKAGTWEAASRELEYLSGLGITVIEVMPIADFPGRFGWGYDGVNLYAPTRLYGRPDDLRRFVDAAHNAGIGVILDVVYNHTGPEGSFLRDYSKDFFNESLKNEWGVPINFDGKNSGPVRDFFSENAAYWIREFHLDGLRIDATQTIFDESGEHILSLISRRARQAANGRDIIIIAENEPQNVKLLKAPEKGGYGIDGLWNDDFHHSAMVALTGRNEAYYSDYLGRPQEFISVAKRGFLYQGQWYSWQRKCRGTPTDGFGPERFINYIQNHDQLANSAKRRRAGLLSAPGKLRALTAFFLLGPSTPMLFQGQEFGASTPFLYFADLSSELMRSVTKGRFEFLRQFKSVDTEEVRSSLPEPSIDSFEISKLDLSERDRNKEAFYLHFDLLKLRKEDPVFRAQIRGGVDGAVLSDEAFVLRFFEKNCGDRLLIVNLGMDTDLSPIPEPLIAPPVNKAWEIIWSSEHPRYGGGGTPQLAKAAEWRLLGHSAIVLKPTEEDHGDNKKDSPGQE